MSTSLKYVLFHLPKTGGTSLFRAFRDWCGNECCYEFRRMDLPVGLDHINPSTVVIHGHFDFADLVQRLDVDHVHLITFLRDPVERVVSNYHFFLKTLREPKLHRREEALANQHRLKESLLEYAEKNQNRMAERLRGAQPEDFAFIGDLSRMDADLNALAEKFGFPQRPTAPRRNVGHYAPPSSAEWDQIAAWNQEDAELYRHWTDAARKINLS